MIYAVVSTKFVKFLLELWPSVGTNVVSPSIAMEPSMMVSNIFAVVVDFNCPSHAYPENLSTMTSHFFPNASKRSMAICLIGVIALHGAVCFNTGLSSPWSSDALLVCQAMHASMEEAMLAFIPGQ